MTLVWKLLRRHLSFPQLAGFFLANLLGMLIVLLGIQFYFDVAPAFSGNDSFLKGDYIVVSKRIGVVSAMSGQNSAFSRAGCTMTRKAKYKKQTRLLNTV